MPDLPELRLQFLRFVAVGLTSNAALYLLYLGFTDVGMDPKLAMSLIYAIGVAQTFLFNKRWTFSHKGNTGVSMVRYVITYALGYLLNLAMLYFFVDIYGLPHQIVQGGAIIVIALVLFLLQRYWVFSGYAVAPHPKSESTQP